jgi:HPt (histidine-containing phosphotransfer) domain-containing protein
MLAATQEQDFDQASKAAHSVLGAVRTAGAREMSMVCEQFKQALDERDVVSVGIFAERVATAFERLRDRIDAVSLAHRAVANGNPKRLIH